MNETATPVVPPSLRLGQRALFDAAVRVLQHHAVRLSARITQATLGRADNTVQPG